MEKPGEHRSYKNSGHDPTTNTFTFSLRDLDKIGLIVRIVTCYSEKLLHAKYVMFITNP